MRAVTHAGAIRSGRNMFSEKTVLLILREGGREWALPARLLTTGAPAALPLPCSDFSVDSSLFPSPFAFLWPPIFELDGCFSFSSGKLLHRLNWCCCYAVIFIMAVAGFTSPVSPCHFCWVDGLAAAAPLALRITLDHFVTNIDPAWAAVPQFSVQLFHSLILNIKCLQCSQWNKFQFPPAMASAVHVREEHPESRRVLVFGIL